MTQASKTCKTCKWWEKGDVFHQSNYVMHPHDPDTGRLMELPFDVRVCTSPNILFYERPVEITQAAVVDGSEYLARLITAEEFYCANHE